VVSASVGASGPAADGFDKGFSHAKLDSSLHEIELSPRLLSPAQSLPSFGAGGAAHSRLTAEREPIQLNESTPTSFKEVSTDVADKPYFLSLKWH